MVKLIIDPGHGGRDPGGGSNEHWLEKDFALKISLYQYKRFQELGVSVALTRDKDIYLSPEERTKLVRESGAKYCISNHINAGGGEGAETIHSIHSNGRLANLILDEIVEAGQKRRRVFFRALPKSPKQDYYFMHRNTGSVETVINEYGFADNSNDVKRLLEHWKEYVEAPVKAFCNYIGHPYAPDHREEKQHDVSQWAVVPQKWVIEQGISDGSRPQAPVTREEVWTMLYRSLNKSV
jgi:N-acetylmuramoyl-L-alanine amidase